VPDVFGSGIGNALERGQEELHRRPPSNRGSPLKNPQLAPLQAPSAQLICDSPAPVRGTPWLSIAICLPEVDGSIPLVDWVHAPRQQVRKCLAMPAAVAISQMPMV
jgi:hypothetical protein